jgi:hypothetical protein
LVKQHVVNVTILIVSSTGKKNHSIILIYGPFNLQMVNPGTDVPIPSTKSQGKSSVSAAQVGNSEGSLEGDSEGTSEGNSAGTLEGDREGT